MNILRGEINFLIFPAPCFLTLRLMVFRLKTFYRKHLGDLVRSRGVGATASDQRQDVEAHAEQCCCKPQPGGQQGAGSRVLVKFPDQLHVGRGT